MNNENGLRITRQDGFMRNIEDIYKGKNSKKQLFSQSLYLCLPLVNCCIFVSLEVEITTFLGLGLDNDLEKVKSLGRDQGI